MRSLALAVALVTACNPPEPPTAREQAAAARAAAIAAIDAAPPPRFADALDGDVIHVPAMAGDVEHRIELYGGDGMWARVATGTQVRPLLSWPTALHVDAAYVEAGQHGIDEGGLHEAWLLVTSLAGGGQPAGMHGVIRVGLPQSDVGDDVDRLTVGAVALAGTTRLADLPAKLDALAADQHAAEAVAADPAKDDALTAALGDPAKASDAALAALIPPEGVAIATTWQDFFVEHAARATTPAALRAALAAATASGAGARCRFVGEASCELGLSTAVLGAEHGALVVRAVETPAELPATTGPRRAVAALPRTDATQRLLDARGTLPPEKVLAEAPYGRSGTIAVVEGGATTSLVVHDGPYIVEWSALVDPDTAGAQVRFADIDGDGRTDAVIAVPDGPTTVYWFDRFGGAGSEEVSGIAAVGAANIDEALARALAVPDQPVTSTQACTLLTSIVAQHTPARVLAYTTPEEPERTAVVKDGTRALHDALGAQCPLVCDAHRPACEVVSDAEADGLDRGHHFLFRWNGAQLELAVAVLYQGPAGPQFHEDTGGP